MKPNTPSKDIAAMRRHLQKENKKYGKLLKEIPKEEWPQDTDILQQPPIEVWRSNKFLVMVYDEQGCKRMSACRTAIGDDGGYKDGITWDDLQALKREIGFGESDAVEIYPADKDIVNVSNMRHLWIFKEEMGLKWKNAATPEAPINNATPLADKVKAAKAIYVENLANGDQPEFAYMRRDLYDILVDELTISKPKEGEFEFAGMIVSPVDNLEGEIHFAHSPKVDAVEVGA